MIASNKGKRFRWQKFIGIAILGYFAFWMVVSASHLWTLWQDEQVLRQKMHIVSQQNQKLRQEIAQLKNPAELKQMLTGKAPFPSATIPRP